MGRKKSKSNLILRWGISMGLISLYLMSQSNEAIIEANEGRSSHIGLFNGETHFSLSSDTGVLPMLELETKDVYGNTEKYESGSEEITIPESNSQATIKSAILKGQTLVNLLTYFMPKLVYIDYQYRFMFSDVDNFDKITIVNKNSKTINFSYFINAWQNYEVPAFNNVLVELPKEANEYNIFALDTFGWDSTNYREAIDNIVLLHGDYANVDIPYFEGMQSVKIPVLTISNEDGSQIATVNIEEDIILRSNGDIYDELDLMTGKFTQRIDEDGTILDEEIIRYVKINSTHVFNQDKEGDISIEGTILSTILSINIPTEPLSFVLNPNETPDKQFIASEFSISNNSQVPINLELKEFVQITDSMKDVLPDYYDDWEDLSLLESKSIALGLVPQVSDQWMFLNEGTYYVANTANAILGRIKPQSTVDFKFSALHGRAFGQDLRPQYRLTFIFDFEN